MSETRRDEKRNFKNRKYTRSIVENRRSHRVMVELSRQQRPPHPRHGKEGDTRSQKREEFWERCECVFAGEEIKR